MRYHPCGAIVDVIRRPYKIACRFWGDSEEEGIIAWSFAAADARELPYTSAIVNQSLVKDKELLDGVGEVWGADLAYNKTKTPPGLKGEHVCGTAADFENGGLFDDTIPPEPLAANGWPRCCSPPKRVRGGAGAGGLAQLVVISPDSPPGPTCETAGALTVGVPTAFHTDTFAQWWWFLGPMAPGSYHVPGATAGGAVGWQLRAGPTCETSGAVATGILGGHWPFSVPEGDASNYWLIMEVPNASVDFSFSVELET